LADLFAAKHAIENSVVEGTNAKQARNWERYKTYLISIGLYGDPYLDNFSCGQKHQILSAFAQAVREGRFSIRGTTNPKSESVRAALDSVAQAFRLAD
jgi:hypothetical protein